MPAPIPEPLLVRVRSALEDRLGPPVSVTDGGRVAGGSINAAVRLDTDRGESFFLKWNAGAGPEDFRVEGDGLDALRAAADPEFLRIPEVVAAGRGGGGAPPWLLLEYVARGEESAVWAERLGRGIAGLHDAEVEDAWGWSVDNVIGALPQVNTPAPDWPTFWRERRIVPQLRMARAGGHFAGAAGAELARLVDRIDEVLADVPGLRPSLLHGDLWGGNVFAAGDGRGVMVDPAVHRGHAEVDLAMSELFGFPRRFLPTYREVRGIDEGYAARRRPLYQLYYLLVHVNLFGGGYVERSRSAAREALAAID